MKIKFLGKWSSNLVKGERNISFIVDDKIVFDFGPHTIESLLDFSVDPRKIEIVAVTHMHLDHFAGLPELFWYRSIYKADKKLIVLGPKGIKSSMESLLKLLRTPPSFNAEFEFIEDAKYEFIQPFRAKHFVPDNGYRLEYKGKSIFYSGDTAYSKNVVKGAEDVDLLLHEMTYTDDKKREADFWKHSTFSSTLKVFEESHAKKLIPVHISKSSEIALRKLVKRNKKVLYPKGSIKI